MKSYADIPLMRFGELLSLANNAKAKKPLRIAAARALAKRIAPTPLYCRLDFTEFSLRPIMANTRPARIQYVINLDPDGAMITRKDRCTTTTT